MLVQNTKICTTRDGRQRAVSELSVGDAIYNAFSDDYDVIADIQLFTVDLDSPAGLAAAPVILLTGSMHGDRPRQDVVVSPEQTVMFLERRSENSGPARIRTGNARNHASRLYQTSGTVTYVALVFESPRFLDVGGIFIEAYSVRDFTSATQYVSKLAADIHSGCHGSGPLGAPHPVSAQRWFSKRSKSSDPVHAWLH